jgi:hypothetical protein
MFSGLSLVQPIDQHNPKLLADFEKSIIVLEEAATGLGHRVAAAHIERSLLGFQAEWHIRGLIYHLRRCFQHHSVFVREVSARASTGASCIIMFAPSFQEMLFEFYALINLAKISLDNLRIYLRPLFVRSSHQLPKSIRDVLAGSSDCPIYQQLMNQPLLKYLMDLRNCLIHYRSFATSDNAFVQEEHACDPLEGTDDPFLNVMARADFRRVGQNAISVNVLLPDRIFEDEVNGGRKMANFSYRERWSLISTAKNIVELTAGALITTLQFLAEVDQPVFHFAARSSK